MFEKKKRKKINYSEMFSCTRAESTVEDTDDGGGQYRFPIFVHVYDMIANNHYMYWAGLGVYHSGIQIFGQGIFFFDSHKKTWKNKH